MTNTQLDSFAGTAFQRPRPSRYDTALQRAAAEAIFSEFEEWLGSTLDENDRERVVEVLARECGQDGYEIAQELEREGYQPDARLVEILDGLDTHAEHAKAVRVWLSETGVRPQLAIGAVVAIPARTKEHEGVVGEIASISERTGEYTVCCAPLGHVREGLGTKGLIFPWEEVEACNAQSGVTL